jgi:hypothetical protein
MAGTAIMNFGVLGGFGATTLKFNLLHLRE